MAEVPKCCDGCHHWYNHSKNCWYFWELKKECTMWTPRIEQEKLQ